ncbi:MAG: hypothetical protein HPY75_14530 [Actinobacteria bacterium]|nr:hypothetical protein [Actinomycetota bacterium]
MRKTVASALFALFLALTAALGVGCGGGGAQELSEPARVFDHALREAIAGNFEPLIQIIPPDLRAYYQRAITQEFAYRNGEVLELNYRTEQSDEDHAVVYFWGTIAYDEGEERKTQVTTSEQAQSVPMVRRDGAWYLDLGEAPAEEPAQSSP